jgi:2-methylisocitrate lyase-like PEP mutase family enzyme
MQSFDQRRTAFRKLHESGCFVIPNPYDVGTARYLRRLGFQALATTSGGFAFTQGLPDEDSTVPRKLMLAHVAEIVNASELPVNADFQSGYAHDPEGVARNVKLCIETGVAGLSIEDATGDADKPLYELSHAVDRIAAAKAAVDESGSGVLLTGRAECYLTGHPEPFTEALRRLERYAAAGADVLYAPGVQQPEEIAAIVKAVNPKPVNVLLLSSAMKVADLESLGVRRVSLGSALARAAWGGFTRAARALAEQGDLSGAEGSMPYGELNEFFKTDHKERSTTEEQTYGKPGKSHSAKRGS